MMVIRKSFLRRRAEHGPETRIVDESHHKSEPSMMRRIASLIYSDGRFGLRHPPRELEGFPLPDLLSPNAGTDIDSERLTHL